MHALCVAAFAAGAVGLAGCTGSSTQVSMEGAGAAEPVTTGQADYRKERFEQAMRGLVISDGLVRIDARAGADLLRGLDAGDAPAAIARGEALMAENDFSGAAGEYRTAILADPENAAGYAGLGDALICKKKDDMALAAYRTAAVHAPDNTAVRLKLAETINRNGDVEGFATELENLLAIDPSHGEAHARLAVAKYFLGDREGAQREIALAERFGGNVPPQLKDMLNN
jgi:tetratricopeptide (TPR) repeat protein